MCFLLLYLLIIIPDLMLVIQGINIPAHKTYAINAHFVDNLMFKFTHADPKERRGGEDGVTTPSPQK